MCCLSNKMKKQGMVWVSTVLYILISLAILGIVIAAVQPRIKSTRDKATIDQTINILNELDQKIIEVDNSAEGNIRSLNLQIKRGILTIDSNENKIEWSLEDASYKYSEPETPIKIGRITALTKEKQGKFNITLTLNYETDINSELISLQPSETPYKIFIKKTAEGIEIY